MPETIKVELEEALARRFRRKAMQLYGYKKGAIKTAMEELVKRFASGGEADWSLLRAKMKSSMDSVELQHKAWSAVD